MNKFLIFILLIGTSEFVISASEKRVEKFPNDFYAQWRVSSLKSKVENSANNSDFNVNLAKEVITNDEGITHCRSSSIASTVIIKNSDEEDFREQNYIFGHSASK